MKSKHIIILGAVFLLLLGALLMKKSFIRPQIEAEEYKKLEISIEPSEIYGIEFKKTGSQDTFKLEKKEGLWRISSKWNIRANGKKIEGLIGDLANLEGELRSGSEKLFSDYGISDNKAFSVIIYGKEGNPLRRLFIGTTKPEYGSSFLRMDDSPKVYMVNRDIFSLFGIYGDPKKSTINTERWADLSILDIQADQVKSLMISRFKEGQEIVTVNLKKELDEEKNLKHWITTEEKSDFDIDAKKIKDFLEGIAGIKAAKALNPENEGYGFDKPYLKILFGIEENPIEVVVGSEDKEGGGNRYIKTPEGYVYLARRYAINKLDIDTSKFFIDNPLRIDKDKLTSVTIKAGKETVALDKEMIAKNTNYVDKLKRFAVEKMLFDEKYSNVIKDPATYSLKIEKGDGQIIELDAERCKDDMHLARLRGKYGIFKIKKNIFDSIFMDLDKLKPAVEKEK